MAEERNFVELRSEEVQEILGTPPSWLVRWGTFFVLLGFSFLLGVAWFVRYPDVVASDKLRITTAEPPVEVVARTDGRVALILVKDAALVLEKQPLAILQNTATFTDVQKLDSLVTVWQSFTTDDEFRQIEYPENPNLGELQSEYALFVRDLEDFQFGRENRKSSVQSNIGSIQLQIRQLDQSIAFEQKALKRCIEDLKIAEGFYERQKELFKQGLISELKLEEERQKVSSFANQRDRHETNLLEKNREVIVLRNSINSANFGQEETNTIASTRLLASLNGLRSSIDKWKQTYVLSAPLEGRVAFNGLSQQQFVRLGESVLTVVPQNQDVIEGQVLLPVEKSGKVTKGLPVVMKLDNYPYQEFGTIAGRVASKSAVPKNREYTIKVDSIQLSPNGKLITSFQKEIPFEQQLMGTAEIITDDKGFLERVLEQVISGFKR
ncbi:MAG: HlyD family secretion protein [Saprospiraceae bacterium]